MINDDKYTPEEEELYIEQLLDEQKGEPKEDDGPSIKSLFDAVISQQKNGRFVAHHLADYGIRGWEDCTRANLSGFPKHLTDAGVCKSTAKNYTAILTATLNRYKEDAPIPCREIGAALKCKGEQAQKVWLNEDELKLFAAAKPKNKRWEFVQLTFLISAKTGMRLSDALQATPDNVADGKLTYVSVKTKIEASVPISGKTYFMLERLQALKEKVKVPVPATYEIVCRKLCEQAGIDDQVKVFKAGRTQTGPKWRFVTSHTARISFATILAEKDVPTRTIMRLMGHTDERSTIGYIASKRVSLNDEASKFFADEE